MKSDARKISVRMFGNCSVSIDNNILRSMPFGYLRISAYLLLDSNKNLAPRWQIGRLIWSDSDNSAANSALRQTLARIKRFQAANNFKYIDADNNNIFLTVHDTVVCDLAQFLSLIAGDLSGAPELCEIYDARFLEAPGVAGSEFEDWLDFQREGLRGQFLEFISEAIGPKSPLSKEQRDRCAHSLIKVDSCNENAYRALMESAANSGQMSVVSHLFDECSRRLDRELNVRPDERTVELYNRLTNRPSDNFAQKGT